MTGVRIPLQAAHFDEMEREIVSTRSINITGFRFRSGVEALRIKNTQGEVVVLPFQGQQVWDAKFGNRRLTMASMFDAPKPTQEFLHTYGALLIHCGATAVGPPGESDDHPPHGELPNAKMDSASLSIEGEELSVKGLYRHTVAFKTNYEFEPTLKIGANSQTIKSRVEITNLKKTDMALFYLAHINFRTGHGVTMHDNASGLRLRQELPSHVTPSKQFTELMERLAKDPGLHREIAENDRFDPEVVLFPEFESDEAIALALHRDGSADFVRYPTKDLRKALRWISRTEDQDCLGLILPATCEGEGRNLELKKGNQIVLRGGERFECSYEFGRLSIDQAKSLIENIQIKETGSGR